MAQNSILLFLPVKFNFCRKKSATKFICLKTSRIILVATLFLYIMVYRRIAGDVPIYLNFALIWPTPSENADFDRFRLIVLQPSRESYRKKSLITNTRSIMRFPSSHLNSGCCPYVPQSLVQKFKREWFTYFCVAFHIFVDTSRLQRELPNFVCRYNILSLCLGMINYPLMGVVRITWPVFLNFGPIIFLESVKLGTSNFVCWLK